MGSPAADTRVRQAFGVLGPLRVTLDGAERPVAGEKLRELLAVLLAHVNRPVQAERLVDALWADDPPATARQSLHVHVGRLRKVLENGDSDLDRSPRGYILRMSDGALDAARFRSTLQAARALRDAGDPGAAARSYRDALALWRGEAFEDVSSPAVARARDELEALRLTALEERIGVDLGLGRAAELVPELEQLVRAHPLREGLRAQLMLALYAAGRQADALDAYQDARRALDGVGLEPGPRLRELEQAVLRQDPALGTAPLPVPGGAAGARPRRRWIGAAAGSAAVLAAAGIALLARDTPPSAAPPPVHVAPNQLLRIDPAANRVASAIAVGRDPASVVFTREAAWVANNGDRTVARVGLAGREVRAVGGAPAALEVAATLAGDVWVSSFEEPWVTLVAEGGKVVGDGGPVAAGPPRVRLPGSAEAMAVGGGYLWVTSPSDSGGRDTVARIDLRTRRLVASTPVGELPLFVAFGHGAAWVANYHGDSVSVVRPGSARPETVRVGRGPLGVTAGAGAVWVVTFWDQELVRLDPETRRVTQRTPVGPEPLDVAAGAGSVWVTNRGDRTVWRIDPRTGRRTAVIRLPAVPMRAEFARGSLWVTTAAAPGTG